MTDLALHSALGSLRAVKQEMQVTSHNIAIADTDNNTKIIANKAAVTSGNFSQGVRVGSFSNMVDEVLHDAMYDKISTAAYTQTIQNYYTKAADLMGKPGDGNSLSTLINKFTASIHELSTSPNSSSLRFQVIASGSNIADRISKLAYDIEQIRYDADVELNSEIEDMNNNMQLAFSAVRSINSYYPGSVGLLNAHDNLRASLEKIAQSTQIKKYSDSDGKIAVTTASGVQLLGDTPYELSYSPITSIEAMVENQPFQSIYITTLDAATRNPISGSSREIVNGGTSEEVFSNLTNGKINALIEMRDKTLPQILEQLNNLAVNLKDQVNAIHNEGNGYPPASKLSGNTLVKSSDSLGFNGKVRLAMVDANGKAAPNVVPLTLDLSSLDTGNGAGKANLWGILQEINYHFGAKISSDNSVQIGNLSDVKLASLSSTFAPSSTISLDLELDNRSGSSSAVTITSATAVDHLGNNILGSFAAAPFTANPTELTRTGPATPAIVLNTPAALNYPFTVTLGVQVVNGTTTSNSTVTYTITAPVSDVLNGVKNTRFSASAATSGLTASTFPTAVLSAQIIDENSNAINPSSSASGVLSMVSNNSNYFITIDNMTSIQLGDLNNNMIGTDEKFSQFFGLNDFFVRSDAMSKWSDSSNVALNLMVRKDIQDNNSLFSSSSLYETPNNSGVGGQPYSFEISNGDSNMLAKYNALVTQNTSFNAAGGLPVLQRTIAGYAADIMSYIAVQQKNQKFLNEVSQAVLKSAQDYFQNSKGVDIDEELLSIVQLQQTFAASAKIVGVIDEMNKLFLNAF